MDCFPVQKNHGIYQSYISLPSAGASMRLHVQYTPARQILQRDDKLFFVKSAWRTPGIVKKTIFNFKYSESPVNTEFTRLSEKYPMRTTGLEPARRRHQNLNLARLPIPPCPQTFHGKHPLSMKKKSQTLKRICGLNEVSGIRTPDNLMNKQVLYRLS